MLSRQMILEIIEEKRNEMIKLAADFGLSSWITVQASQELDMLLNAIANEQQIEFHP